MSDSNGPVRRRRIAGESGPASPAKKAVVKKANKPVANKPVANKPGAKITPVMKGKAEQAPAVAKVAARKPAAKKVPTAAPVVARPVAKTIPADQPATREVPRRQTAASPTSTTDSQRAERPAGSRPRRRDLIWLVPATIVAVAAMAVGVFLIINPPGAGDGDLDASRRQASSAAASAAETIFTFRYDELDQHLEASKALMTPAFAKDFDEIAPALTELAPQRNIVVQAVARDAAALPCGDDCSSTTADVLVFVDQARLIGDSTEPTVFANRIKVSMVKGDDGWLVNNIRAL